MNQLEVNGRTVPLNPHGFLVSFDDWDESVAREMAIHDGLELTDCHWAAIRFAREFYYEFDVPPSPRILINEVGEKIREWGCTRKTLEEVFPKGGCKHVCRLAGLPAAYCHSC
ncbi:MAG: TusE/DsrC/DsvC family sulfur relay protein [Sedimenticola sp.]